MQVPQARPGTRCGASGIANSSPFMRSSSLRAYLQRRKYSVNAARRCRRQRGRVTMTKDTMHLAAFTAIAGSLIMAIGLFVPARTVAQGAEQSTGLLQGRTAFTDWSADRPGLRRRIKPADLPAADLRGSVSNSVPVTGRPANQKAVVPAGFEVSPVPE